MAKVELVDITKKYGNATAVDRFSAEVADGEFVTLLGPSGCGKTTTLRMVAGLVDPSAGQILFDDQVVNRVPAHKRNIGLAFQSHALFPHMSVAKNVAFGLSVKRIGKKETQQRVEEMLHMVELDQYADRMPSQLSGGQQQRVALARMLATDPRVLLFDEPLSALDRNLRDQLKYSILDLQRKSGKTAIYVTHDQSEAFAISDRIIVMNQGRIEQTGSQLDIYLRPQSEFVANFVGDNNALKGVVTGIASDEEGQSRAVIDVQGQRFVGVGPADLQVGEPVLLFIRPENIHPLADGEEVNRETNLLTGQVSSIVFEGPVVRLIVDCQGQPIKVMSSGLERLVLLDSKNQEMRLAVDEASVVRDPATSSQ